MDWLTQHMDDTDLNEQLLIVGQTGEGSIAKEYAGNLSKEERIKIAEEKIAEGRKRRAAEEIINKREAEKMQRFANKEMMIAKRKLEDGELDAAMALRKKEKAEFEAQKYKV